MAERHIYYSQSSKCTFNTAVAAMVIIDLSAFMLSFFIAYILFPIGFSLHFYLLPLLGCCFFLSKKSYLKHLTFLQESVEIVEVISAIFLLGFLFIIFEPFLNVKLVIFIILVWINALYLLPLARYAGKSCLVKMGLWKRTIIILGTGKRGQSIAQIITKEFVQGYKIMGFLTGENDQLHKFVTLPSGSAIPVLGALESAEEIIKNGQNIDIILAAPDIHTEDCFQMARRLQWLVPSLLLVFNTPDISVYREAGHFVRGPWLALHVENNLLKNKVIKRAFDLIIGCSVLLVSLPLLLIISFMLKIDSQGPVFFAHTRVGRYGRPFKCWKFRTMCTNAEEVLNSLISEDPALKKQWEEIGKLKDDPRVTRIGRILRKTSLDELPQIFNVLKGEMSLVGPRPLSPRWTEKYGGHLEARALVRPGITGLWQVNGRNDIEYSERINLDSWYIRNWSIGLDIIILLRTVLVVLNRRGAY